MTAGSFSASARLGKLAVIILAIAIVTLWAASGIEINPARIVAGMPQVLKIFQLMWPMDWPYLPTVVERLIETFQIALLGTTIAAFLAVPFGFLGARNLAWFKSQPYVVKVVLDAVRTFPEILLGLIFIRGVGPGPYAGVLTLGVHSIGMLGKLYADVVEGIDPSPQEALYSCGATRLQVTRFAVIPQVLPEFASQALYRFEINMRAASVLGLVGAGGIGIPLIFSLYMHDWPRVGLILAGIVIVVISIDFISSWLRSKLV
jgi:phosphonate transport system permease protein